jgi:type II secretory pathway component PulJ
MGVIFRAGATVLLLALLAGCASSPLEAISDYDKEFDFSTVQRLAILPIDRTSAAEKLISDMQVARIEAALTTELESRGYEVVEDRIEADVYLSWHLVTREKTDIRSYNASSAYNCWRCGPPVSDLSVRQYTEGTFIVDLIDPRRNRSVWRSTIQSQLKLQSDPEKSAQNRALAAKAVLAPFPPSPGGA